MRTVPAPVEALPALSDLLARAAPDLAAAAAQAVYEGMHTGWFASSAGLRQVERWALSVGSAARTGDYEAGTEATRKLTLQGSLAGATLLERHTMVERLGELIVRDLQRSDVDRPQLLAVRRLIARFRQTVLEGL